jgi:uncharacterized protein
VTRLLRILAVFMCVVSLSSCQSEARLVTVPLSIQSKSKLIRFQVEVARTGAEQSRGLMFRKSLPKNGGMIFPMSPQREVSFWMKNTVIPLDMIFIRADGSIARIAAETIPYSLEPVSSGEPVASVLEIAGGRAATLGISEDDVVRWQGK